MQERDVLISDIPGGTGRLICQYDVNRRTLTVPRAYAERFGIPVLMRDVPYPAGTETPGAPKNERERTLRRLFEAILRGDPSGGCETRRRDTAGRMHWEKAEFISIFDEAGRPESALITIQDTTAERERARENRRLRESEQIMRMVAEHSERSICCYDVKKNAISSWDGGDCALCGYERPCPRTPERLIQTGVILPESVDDLGALFEEIRGGAGTGEAKIHIRLSSGQKRWFSVKFSTIFNERGQPAAAVLSTLDITERHEQELSYARYVQSINMNQAGQLIYIEADLTADLVEKTGGGMLTEALQIGGRSHTEAIEGIISRYFPEKARAQARAYFSREHLMTLFADGKRDEATDWQIRFLADGLMHWARVSLQLVADPYTGHIKAFALIRDVTPEKEAQMTVQRRAELDGMTGLYNRATAEAYIRARLAVPDERRCLLMLLDLDGLKGINDSLGHAQGDRAIKEVAAALKKHFRATDIIGRAGGDEFLVYLPGIVNEAALRLTLSALLRAIGGVGVGESNERSIHCSAGCAVGTPGLDSFETLFSHADTALYHVKRNGKNDYAFYTPRMQMADYRYQGHTAVTLKNDEMFDPNELRRLIGTLAQFYPLVLSANLSRNVFYLMESGRFFNSSLPQSGTVDEFMRAALDAVHPLDREAARAGAARDALLESFKNGGSARQYYCRLLDDEGKYRWVMVIILLYQRENGDVCAFSFVRAAAEKDRERELRSLQRIMELVVQRCFEYICVVHVDTGLYELYGGADGMEPAMTRSGSYDEGIAALRDGAVLPAGRDAYYAMARLDEVRRRMATGQGHYSFRYTLYDGAREAAFYRFEPSDQEILLTVRRVGSEKHPETEGE